MQGEFESGNDAQAATTPRSPQNESGCSSVLARTNRPSASTTEAARRLSIASPKPRISQPGLPHCRCYPEKHSGEVAAAVSAIVYSEA